MCWFINLSVFAAGYMIFQEDQHLQYPVRMNYFQALTHKINA